MLLYKFMLFVLLWMSVTAHAESTVVFAAASLTNALNTILEDYRHQHPTEAADIKTAFASSSSLAKQMTQGAPAQVFISADTLWMDYVKTRGFLDNTSITPLLKNQLVLIAPKGRSLLIQWSRQYKFSEAFDGKLCTGETSSVPAGIYAKQSLGYYQWWDALTGRIVGSQDVRAALVMVERGECDVGIVYATDAAISSKVEVIGIFPDESHETILYPIALTKEAVPSAKAIYTYLKSPAAAKVFKRYGFEPLVQGARP